jgi:hypothetical protein
MGEIAAAAKRAKLLAELAPDPSKSRYRDYLLDPDEIAVGAGVCVLCWGWQ